MMRERSRSRGVRNAIARAAVFGLLLGIALGGSDARASDNLDLDQTAAALVLPVITGGYSGNPIKGTQGDILIPTQDAITLVSVTNGKSTEIALQISMISGDPEGKTWQATSFDCPLTGRETTTFVFEGLGSNNAGVYVECTGVDFRGDPRPMPVGLFTNFQNGIMFIAIATGDAAVAEDVLFGDAVVVDSSAGFAYSFGAITVQSGKGLSNGDRIYRFDDVEYRHWPSALATNFLAPTHDIDAELILFTLDGTTGGLPLPRAKVGGLAYNDDEVAFDLSHEFDCFDIVALEEMNPNLYYTGGAVGLGSVSGHLELVPQPIGTASDDSHDQEFGDKNNVRTRAVHGWIAQRVLPAEEMWDEAKVEMLGWQGGLVLPGDEPILEAPSLVLMGSEAAWGRPLNQSTTPITPFLNDDDAVLNADARE